MNDLLDFVLDKHGGLKRWSGVSTLTVKLAVGGPFWGQQMAGWARGYPKLAESIGRSHDTAIHRDLTPPLLIWQHAGPAGACRHVGGAPMS